MLTSICFTSRMVHKDCLDVIFDNSQVISLIINGPKLTSLPFLADCEAYARHRGIKPVESTDLTAAEITTLATQVDIGISIGFGKILSKNQFNAPTLGTFNLHPSELPKYRGMHPCLNAIMDGENTLGITLHRMDTGIDTGPIISKSIEPVKPEDDIVSLTNRLYSQGAELLKHLFVDLGQTRSIKEEPQSKATTLDEPRYVINWNDSAWRINNQVRALTFPWPLARTTAEGVDLLVSKVRVVEDGVVDPGKVLSISGEAIQVGTGGNSIEIVELRDRNRNLISLTETTAKLNIKAGRSRFGPITNR